MQEKADRVVSNRNTLFPRAPEYHGLKNSCLIDLLILSEKYLGVGLTCINPFVVIVIWYTICSCLTLKMNIIGTGIHPAFVIIMDPFNGGIGNDMSQNFQLQING
jgi:hypothetical protein